MLNPSTLKPRQHYDRKIIHIDMDCFYAAIEMRDAPELRHRPMAVGGLTSERGVISTANYLARQFGVKSAMSTASALRLCPQLVVVPTRMADYKRCSMQIHTILRQYTHCIEPLSLDEAYLDVTHSSHCQGSATLIAYAIRQQIEDELQLTASAGIAPIKFLAKIASDINKPNGQYVIPPEAIPDFIMTLPLRHIPGVGRVNAQKLSDLGLETCGDVQRSDRIQLAKTLGKLGHILWERCHGIDHRPVESQRLRKSVGVERTTIDDLTTWPDCLALIDRLYQELTQRLSKVQPDQAIAGQGVKMKFDDFQQTTQEHVAQQLNKEALIEMAHHLWHERRQDRGVRLIGLHVTLRSPWHEKQLSLHF